MRKYGYTDCRSALPLWLILCSCLALMILHPPASAQVTGSINGTVVDTTQAAIPGAKLVLTNTQTGDTRQLTSSEQGFFNFADLPRGEYTIKVNAQGFRELEVFRLIGEGRSTRQIAGELHLSVRTVEAYREYIKGKLNLKNAAELTQYATSWVQREIPT